MLESLRKQLEIRMSGRPGWMEKSRRGSSARDGADGVDPDACQAVSIVVPTFREAANIPRLVERVHACLSASSINWELVLVDDNSGDGSDSVVEALARTLPVRINIRRDLPRDLSLSVLLGFRLARFERLVVLDADLSHPPERIVDLLAALDADCDMVVGSRYTLGGVLERNWSPWSFLNSRVATVLALPLVKCSDPMSGFFAIRRSAVPSLESLRPIGYKIGLELMVRGRLRVKEVPIGFADRSAGSSKMNWRQQVSFLRHLLRLYPFKCGGLIRALCFVLVGASGMVIDLALYLNLQWIGLDHRLARFLSFWPAVTWNWFLNRRITFSDRPPSPRMRQWARFVTSCLAGLATNVGTYTILTTFIDVFDRYRLIALFCGIALGGIVNFLAATLYVYREHSASRPTP